MKFRAKEHISPVAAQNSKHPQILVATPNRPNDYPYIIFKTSGPDYHIIPALYYCIGIYFTKTMQHNDN